MVGVTRGLDYLHNNGVVHGELKNVCGAYYRSPKLTYHHLPQSNILIDANGSPRLCDFGLWPITRIINSGKSSTSNQPHAVRYCAPELLDAKGVARVHERKPTKKSDMYSLSMVIVEARPFSECIIHTTQVLIFFCVQLVTGTMLFPRLTDPDVYRMMSKGIGPPPPRRFDAPGMTLAVWKIAKKCWHQKAERRPEVTTVLQSLESIANPGVCAREAPPCLEWEVTDVRLW